MRIFLSEWRGRLYTPDGPMDVMAHKLDARIDPAARPQDEGLYDYDLIEETDENDKKRKVLRFQAVTDLTPEDATIPFARVGLVFDGDRRTRWPVGFTTIVGPAASGKTRLAPLLAQRENGVHVLFGEPAPGSLPYSPTAYSGVLNRCLTGDASLYVVDSMRMATLAGGGQLGPGGIPRDMGSQISQIDYAARLNGKAIFGIVNLLTTDPRATESALEVLTGSCTAVIQTEGISGREGDVRVVGSVVIRPKDRQPTSFYVTISQ